MSRMVGVVGAGTMGRGVALDLVLHGMKAVVVDIDPDSLKAAEDEIKKTARFAPMLNKSLKRISASDMNDALVFSTELAAVAECDFIVENVSEDWDIKAQVYKDLDRICGPDTVFGVNTSCIPISRIGGLTQRADKVVGMHFMNPVFMKPVIEVMRGTKTSDETLVKCEALLADMGKEAIVVNDMAGFVSNRISHLFMNEAAWVVQDGVATPEQVDNIFKKCFGHTMGPLATADLIGLDVVKDSLQVLYESYQDPKFRCCPLLAQKVFSGDTGKKAGKGFFDYPENS